MNKHKHLSLNERFTIKALLDSSAPFKIDHSCRLGRTHEDFKLFLENQSVCPIVQLVSVEGTRGR